MKKLPSTILPMLLSLTCVCLLAGTLLGVVHYFTEEPIAATEKIQQEKAIKAVLPKYKKLETDTINGMPRHKAFTKSGEYVGVAIESTADGFGGPFTIIVGFDATNEICGYQVLKHQETPGLGSKMTDWFVEALAEWTPGDKPLSVKKDGGSVEAITAATISSRAFLVAVNQAIGICIDQNVDQTTGATRKMKGN
ncbi:MAG: RnfABCDGE type electron transport complex subunit G [Paludibacteraceae bacterium]|nr:RnfABCDGE type electron transport complex subunit G [Paludibacteraceae bacterium]